MTEIEKKIHNQICDFFDNNNFVKQSSFNDLFYTQIFHVTVSNKVIAQKDLVDVIGFNIPTVRNEFVELNVFNVTQNINTLKSVDSFRIKLLEDSNTKHRNSFFDLFFNKNNMFNSSYYTQYPSDLYFDIEVKIIRKSKKTQLLEYADTMFKFKNCYVENINDIDLDVSEFKNHITEISGKCGYFTTEIIKK